MEKSPAIKCEQFAWNNGLRIVDLCELSKQLHCKQCRSLLDLRQTEREERYGLASILFILCKCGATNDVHTGKLQHSGQRNSPDPIFEVNAKATVNLLMFKADASRILGFLALLDIPVPASDDPALTPLLKGDSADSTFPPDYPPSEMRALYTSPATAFSVDPDVPGTSLPPSCCICGPDSGVDSVPLVLPSHQRQGREGGEDHEDNDNGCDNDESVLSLSEGDLKERRKDMAISDASKAGICKREDKTTCDISNKPHILENNKEKEEHAPPQKIRTKAQNLHRIKKPSTEPSNKTRAAFKTREPLKIVVQKLRKTRVTKLKKDTQHHAQTVKEQDTEKQAENNNIDFSNTMEWSSTELEPEAEASQDGDSDASWEAEEEKETAAKPKRGRGRPKGSTDKVKRTRKRGRDTTNSVCDAELKTEGVGGNSVPRCDACGKDFSSARGYNLHVRRMHKQDGPLQKPVGSKRGRQKQEEGRGEEADSETREPSVIAPEGQWHVAKEEEVTVELFRCPPMFRRLCRPQEFLFPHWQESSHTGG